jgi:hypothetical protein
MLKKSEAIAKLQQQIKAIEAIARLPRFSPESKKWHRDTEVAIEHIFGPNTRHLQDFRDVSYQPSMWGPGTPESYFDERFREGLQHARSVLESLVDEVNEYWELDVLDQLPAPLSRIERLCDRFHLMARSLRVRHDKRSTIEVEDEYDVQDLFHALLKLDFEDIRREEWTPSYAGGSSRLDFLLKPQGIVIEVKKTRKQLGPKEVGDQLLIDIGRYQSHPDCRVLVCFVYDPESRIGNPSGLESDLSHKHGKINVKVIVAPKGL